MTDGTNASEATTNAYHTVHLSAITIFFCINMHKILQVKSRKDLGIKKHKINELCCLRSFIVMSL